MIPRRVSGYSHKKEKGEMMNLHDRRAHAAQPSGRPPRLLLLTIIFITIVCFEAHAETFDVPGTSGNGWLDTRLDLAPGTLVRLAASGQVDVGAGWGVHGPEGTTHFADVAGYPAETRFRYGLVARLTESRTNPADELRNDYDYGTTREFCASGGGHLWLTVNDNHAVNNTGQFRVVMTRGSCQPDPVGPSTRLAERFRITINGFACEHPTIDDPTQRDGVDDEVFVQADLSLYNLSGAYNQASVKSAVIGDSNNFSTRIRSGSGYSIFGGNGGINGRDTFPAGGRPWERFSEPRRDRPPLLVWEGELVSSEKALLIIPSIWEWDGDVSLENNQYVASLAAVWNDPEIQSAMRTAISTPRNLSLPAADRLRSLFGEVKVGKAFPGDPKNRPVGMTERGAYYVFNPQYLVLTYEAAELMARSNNNGLGPGVIKLVFRDDDQLQGVYSLYIQVEMLTRR
jgi:hypothetical protein